LPHTIVGAFFLNSKTWQRLKLKKKNYPSNHKFQKYLKTMEYHWGRLKYKVYTEQEKNDEVYVHENRHIITEKVRTLSADKLRVVESVLNGC